MAPPNIFTLLPLITSTLREPVTTTTDAQGEYIFTFNPPLTAGEQTTLNDLVTMAKFGLTSSLTLAEFTALKPDLALAKTFVGIASPTAAQSNAALKATIRVLGALLRQ